MYDRDLKIAYLVLKVAHADKSDSGNLNVAGTPLENYNGDNVDYHCAMLKQHGCFLDNPTDSTKPLKPLTLSWKGHDLLLELEKTLDGQV